MVDHLVSLTRTFPPVSQEKLLAVMHAWPTGAIFQSPTDKVTRFAFGAVAQVSPGDHADQFQALKIWMTHLRQQVADPDAVAVFGSFAFDPGNPAPGPFGPLQRGLFLLPKILVTPATDHLTATIIGPQASDLASHLTHFMETLATVTPTTIAPQVLTITEPGVSDWAAGVAATTQQIATGQLTKVVLARTCQVTTQQAIRPEQLWATLTATQPETYHLLLKQAGYAFISATPERFLQVTPQSLKTAAIAGTAPRGDKAEQDKALGAALLADTKNRQEQAFVTETITKVLQQFALTVTHPAQPGLLKNPNVQHLYTPITASGQRPLFDVLAALHPTPALGGLPKAAAQQQIRHLEPVNRGLFGAPMGYLTLTETGELAVAIRSAVMHQTAATLFTGAGIVKDSIPSQEVAETHLKFTPILQALGGPTQ